MGLVLLAAAFLLFLLVGAICGLAALTLARDMREQLSRQRDRLGELGVRLDRIEGRAARALPEPEEASSEIEAEEQPRVPWLSAIEARQSAPPPLPGAAPVSVETPREAEMFPQASPPVVEEAPEDREPTPSDTAPASESGVESESRIQWAERFEEAVGKRWTVWVGALVIFAGMGFFVKYAFEQRWIGPGARVVAGALLGVALLAAGHRSLRRKMRALGQGLIGGGMAVTYVSLYAAFALYGLIPRPVAFLVMAATTAAGMALAVTHDSPPVSVLAALGGFLTPVLLRTGADPRDALFGYVVALDLGVLGVAFFKRWRALDALAFAGTAALYAAWFFRFYTEAALLPAMLWLGAIYAVFLLLPFAHHLLRRTRLTVERFGLALAGAAFFAGYAYRILRDDHPHALGYLVLAMAACYAALGALTRRRVPDDERARFGFVTLAMIFLTLGAPLHFEMDGITLSWVAEAVALICLGYIYRYEPVRLGGFLALALALFRVFAFHLAEARHAAPFVPILNRPFLMLMCGPLGAAACSAVHFAWRKLAKPADVFVRRSLAVAAGLMLLAFLHIELEQWLALRATGAGVDPDYLKWFSLNLLWALGACGFLAAGLPPRHGVFRLAGALPLGVAVGLAVFQYARLEGMAHPYTLALNGRFAAAAITCAVLFGFGLAFRDPDRRVVTLILSGYALLGLFHAESHFWLRIKASVWEVDFSYLSSWWMTALWALGACGFLVVHRLRKPGEAPRAGLVPLLVAVGYAVRLYFLEAPAGYALFANARFVAAAVACAVAYAFAFSAREGARAAPASMVGLLMLVLLHVELQTWMEHRLALTARDADCRIRVVLSLLWTAGSLGMLIAGARVRGAFARNAAALALVYGAVFVFVLYSIETRDYLPVLNGRFLAGLAACAALGAHVRLRRPGSIDERERTLRAALFWCLLPALLLLLSAEPYLWIRQFVEDPERARWQGQMSVSIVWGLYATALLVVGFWRKTRPLRLAALALFGITVLKLVLVDMANVEQVYRIVSFLALGSLMIGASYLYHKVEKGMADGGE